MDIVLNVISGILFVLAIIVGFSLAANRMGKTAAPRFVLVCRGMTRAILIFSGAILVPVYLIIYWYESNADMLWAAFGLACMFVLAYLWMMFFLRALTSRWGS